MRGLRLAARAGRDGVREPCRASPSALRALIAYRVVMHNSVFRPMWVGAKCCARKCREEVESWWSVCRLHATPAARRSPCIATQPTESKCVCLTAQAWWLACLCVALCAVTPQRAGDSWSPCDAMLRPVGGAHAVPEGGRARRHRLKTQMEWCMAHPEELSKVAGLQKKVDEVKVRAGLSS